MHIAIVTGHFIPVHEYGGVERVLWYLAQELVDRGHKVTFIADTGSHCDFADMLHLDDSRPVHELIPHDVDVVMATYSSRYDHTKISYPLVMSFHGNAFDGQKLHINTCFVSGNHAHRYGSKTYVYNGMDWDDYGKVELDNQRRYFHFLGMAAWRIKNLRGCIKMIRNTPDEELKVLGGHRLNFRMGFRLTLSRRIKFCGMVGGETKNRLLQGSKGLLFPVRWDEPFGLAMTESLYFGCPVFGTPYGSLPELINEDVGLLSNNSSELTEAIMQVDRYSRKRCHEYARDLFNASVMTDRYLEVFERVARGEYLNDSEPQILPEFVRTKLDWN